jgi:hypothetical protein
MLRHRSYTIALIVLLVALSPAQAAEPTGTLTLACEGTRTATWRVGGFGEEKTRTEPISMSIIIDFRAQTGEYFETRTDGWEDRRSLQISGATEMNISFKADWFVSEDKRDPNAKFVLDGRIDRVTGALVASRLGGGEIVRYSLKCKPTQRMF